MALNDTNASPKNGVWLADWNGHPNFAVVKRITGTIEKIQYKKMR